MKKKKIKIFFVVPNQSFFLKTISKIIFKLKFKFFRKEIPWKKKNWKDVKNPDLWKKLDAVCANRNIEWNWIKGHAGHRGNEMADQLANIGAEQTAKQNLKISQANADTKKPESDWLLDDPFGLDLDAEADELIEEIEIDLQVTEQIEENIEVKSVNESSNPYIVITDAKLNLQGPRQLILDTETTGFYYQDNDRIIEVGAIEMINRKLTGSSIHIYINPEKPVGDSVDVHGITDEFLADKPKYAEIADVLFEFLKGAEIIAHNATFDMNFLDMEFKRAGLPALSEVCEVTDTLALAKNKHPGQKNSLDALVRRYEIPARDRTFHGALLDAEILADVYLAMTGGQVSFDMDALSQTEQQQNKTTRQRVQIDLPIIYPTDDELQQHETWVKQFEEKHGKPCFFAK